MPRLNPWYVTGLCEGEAAFTYSRRPGDITPVFGFRLREDDLNLVQALRQFFQVGTIYKVKGKPGGGARNRQDAWYYRVSDSLGLLKIIEHFDQYPLSGKKLRA